MTEISIGLRAGAYIFLAFVVATIAVFGLILKTEEHFHGKAFYFVMVVGLIAMFGGAGLVFNLFWRMR